MSISKFIVSHLKFIEHWKQDQLALRNLAVCRPNSKVFIMVLSGIWYIIDENAVDMTICHQVDL